MTIKIDLLFNTIMFSVLGAMLSVSVAGASITMLSPDEAKDRYINLYLDCSSCDIDYIRTRISYINYVSDPLAANLHVLVASQNTGSGGREYTFCLCGQEEFAGMNDTLRIAIFRDATEEEKRIAMVNILKLGLVRYLAKTPLINRIAVHYNQAEEPGISKEKWDYWVFRMRLNSSIRGEKSANSFSLSGRVDADRVTPQWKLRFSLDSDYDRDHFETEDENITSISQSRSFDGLIVKSISDHWSAGVSTHVYSSTYRNIRQAVMLDPAIEYSVFPYAESTMRELRIYYRAGYRYSWYRQETIYNKMYEGLVEEALSIVFETKKTWGSARAGLSGSHLFHDFNKNNLHFSSDFSIRIFKGFSLNLEANLSMIHDQLSLPKESIATEEILLQRQELATQYEYRLEAGFSYTFGEIYNNVVNPRFGD